MGNLGLSIRTPYRPGLLLAILWPTCLAFVYILFQLPLLADLTAQRTVQIAAAKAEYWLRVTSTVGAVGLVFCTALLFTKFRRFWLCHTMIVVWWLAQVPSDIFHKTFAVLSIKSVMALSSVISYLYIRRCLVHAPVKKCWWLLAPAECLAGVFLVALAVGSSVPFILSSGVSQAVTVRPVSPQFHLDLHDESVALINPENDNKFSRTENERVLFFWATWCKGCSNELRELEAALEAFPTIDVACVSIDAAGTPRDMLVSYLRKVGTDMPCYHDPMGTVWQQAGIKVVPSALLKDARGRAAYIYEGSGLSERLVEDLGLNH